MVYFLFGLWVLTGFCWGFTFFCWHPSRSSKGKSGALELNFRGANPISEGIIEFDIVAPMHQL